MMEKNVREYLAGLVRLDLRKKQRGLANFAPRPHQDPEVAEIAREKVVLKIVFCQAVLDGLNLKNGCGGSDQDESLN